MNISTLKPLAWYEIMEGYARHKLAEAQLQDDNKQSTPCISPWHSDQLSAYGYCHACKAELPV